MHELSLATDIVQAACVRLAAQGGHEKDLLASLPGRSGGMVAKRLVVRVGELSGVNAESLSFCLQAACGGTPLEAAEIDVTTVRPALLCPACGEVACAGRFDTVCPRCGRTISGVAGGRELDVELECDGPDVEGAEGDREDKCLEG